jgi:hypothetical protein
MIAIPYGFVKTILIALVFLFATLFANFWFTVIAYTYNTKNNSSINPYTSNLEVGSYNDDNNNDLLALHNITNNVSFKCR